HTSARDLGPFTVRMADGAIKLLDFQFNGWGLKFAADRDNLATQSLADRGVFAVGVENRRGFVLEGGSIESDGCGTLLTTSQCLLSPNRNAQMSHADIEAYLCEAFGADRVLWLDHGAMAGDDTDSHIDTLCRLAPGDTIVYTGTSDTSDEHYEELARMKEQIATFRTSSGEPYRMVQLPLPDAIYDADCGERLPATYANYLVLDGRILMPGYGQPHNDRMAADALRVAYPDHEVEIIDCRALIRQHGSLHCITMQIPLTALSQYV
ncbi:MAG: agmatine deiminase family protein, partial [Muribaculaceae bacterium]|nr:agmatine deiminase family protein [Muribaculaceae bacterium]